MTSLLFPLWFGVAMAQSTADPAAINQVLDAFHQAAAEADADAYFGAMADDFVFLGTDATERWPKKEFEAFARPYFERGTAWTYTPVARNVVMRADTAWFDERLKNEKYGEARGSGVLVREAGAWKVAQYVLSFPIPNAIAGEVTERIQREAKAP